MKNLFKKQRSEEGAVAVAEPEAKSESLSDSPVDVHAELASIQTELNCVQADRSRLEEESRILAERLSVNAAQSEEAKLQMASCAGGSGDTTATLDALDRERVELQRRREGIQLRLDRLAQRQAPLQARARQVAQIADQQRQDDAVEKFQATAEQLSKQVIDGWLRACRDSYELVVTVEDAVHAGNLDDVHRSQILGINERLNVLFQREGLRVVNESWVRRESHLFRRMQIVAARPK